jgi:hypothetical protein
MITHRFGMILSLAAAAALAGCAAPQGVANADRSFFTAKRSTGLLAASVTVSGHVPGSVWVQLVRSGDSSPPLSIPVNVASFGLDWDPASDSTGRSFQGRVAAVELSPGEYEFGRWVMNVGNSAVYVSGGRIGARVSIKPGEATYAGNIHIDIQRSAGATLPSRIDLNDESRRDLPLLVRKYPEMKLESVRIAIASSGEPVGAARPKVRMEDLDGLIRAR